MTGPAYWGSMCCCYPVQEVSGFACFSLFRSRFTQILKRVFALSLQFQCFFFQACLQSVDIGQLTGAQCVAVIQYRKFQDLRVLAYLDL